MDPKVVSDADYDQIPVSFSCGCRVGCCFMETHD